MSRGYSLLELTIVMSIASLLIFFAFPTFQQTILRAHRIDGQMALLDLANRMEHFYLEQGSYQKATIQTGSEYDVLASNLSPEGFYELAITQLSDNDYILQATAHGIQHQDKQCPVLTYDHSGVKGTLNAPFNIQCWS